MEYCGGGSCANLLKFYKCLEEDTISYIVKSCVQGLQYLHSQGKIHRDIKAANILVTQDGRIKLADFGVSSQLTVSQAKKHTLVGTPLWMAPEVIKVKSGYNEKCDIWSLGITTIELVRGTPPYSEIPPMKILFEIPYLEPPVLVGPKYSSALKSFVSMCLKKNPNERPSASALLSKKFLQTEYSSDKLASLVTHMQTESGSKLFRKKPRHPLNQTNEYKEEEEEEEDHIEWSFSKKLELPPIPTLIMDDETLKEKDLVASFSNVGKYSKIDLELSDKSQSPELSTPGNSPRHRSSRLSSFHRKLSNIKPLYYKAASKFTQQQNVSTMAPAQIKPNSVILKTHENTKPLITRGVLLFLLKRMEERAKKTEVKDQVVSLQETLMRFDEKVPGLCDAFCQEIFLKMRQANNV